jgi:hypothetical protein
MSSKKPSRVLSTGVQKNVGAWRKRLFSSSCSESLHDWPARRTNRHDPVSTQAIWGRPPTPGMFRSPVTVNLAWVIPAMPRDIRTSVPLSMAHKAPKRHQSLVCKSAGPA